MNCTRCAPRIAVPVKQIQCVRAFHQSPASQRLGAFTYAQEWQTGTYHYNKAYTKTLPLASQHVDELLSAYATQQEPAAARKSPIYQQATRSSILAQRQSTEAVFFSKSTAKDFGDHIEVSAFVYDSRGAKEAELDKRKAKSKAAAGTKSSGGRGGGTAGRSRRPMGGAPSRSPGFGRPAAPGEYRSSRPRGYGGGLGGRGGTGTGGAAGGGVTYRSFKPNSSGAPSSSGGSRGGA